MTEATFIERRRAVATQVAREGALAADARILVLGGDSLAAALSAAGYDITRGDPEGGDADLCVIGPASPAEELARCRRAFEVAPARPILLASVAYHDAAHLALARRAGARDFVPASAPAPALLIRVEELIGRARDRQALAEDEAALERLLKRHLSRARREGPLERDRASGALSAAAFERHVRRAIARARLDGVPFSLLALRFAGPEAAAALKGAAALLRRVIRADDQLGRLSEHALVLLFAKTDATGAQGAANRLLPKLALPAGAAMTTEALSFAEADLRGARELLAALGAAAEGQEPAVVNNLRRLFA
jgi:GGDEF domain-containing protein